MFRFYLVSSVNYFIKCPIWSDQFFIPKILIFINLFDVNIDVLAGDNSVIVTVNYPKCEITNYAPCAVLTVK